MDELAKLRLLIWDKESIVFTDTDLQEFLADAGGNIYKAAAHCLNNVRANPERLRSFAVFTYEDLDNAIKYYEKIARQGIKTSSIPLKKVY
jgi:5-bromo-4-chloroindolyl phosphate hydrolysis protein